MKVWVAAALVWTAWSGSAYAQLRPSSEPTAGYVSVIGQSAFGDVTSQSFGAELGIGVVPQFQIVAEVGRTLDVAPKSIGPAAQAIAGQILINSNGGVVAYTVKVPVSFATGALKFVLPVDGKLQPYVLAGFGAAQVTRNVKFTVAGADITSALSLPPYYITLGSDLSGSEVKPLFVAGGGLAWSLSTRVFADFDFRYNRILSADIPLGRAGLGIGVRF